MPIKCQASFQDPAGNCEEAGICPSHLRNSRKVVEGKGCCGEKITLRLI